MADSGIVPHFLHLLFILTSLNCLLIVRSILSTLTERRLIDMAGVGPQQYHLPSSAIYLIHDVHDILPIKFRFVSGWL